MTVEHPPVDRSGTRAGKLSLAVAASTFALTPASIRFTWRGEGWETVMLTAAFFMLGFVTSAFIAVTALTEGWREPSASQWGFAAVAGAIALPIATLAAFFIV